MSVFIDTSLYLLCLLFCFNKEYTPDSHSLKEEHSSYNDVPMKVIQKVMKNSCLHKYCLGKKGMRKKNIISSRAYGQGVGSPSELLTVLLFGGTEVSYYICASSVCCHSFKLKSSYDM